MSQARANRVGRLDALFRLVSHVSLLIQKTDDRVGCVFIELSGLSSFKTDNIATEFDRGTLHA